MWNSGIFILVAGCPNKERPTSTTAAAVNQDKFTVQVEYLCYIWHLCTIWATGNANIYTVQSNDLKFFFFNSRLKHFSLNIPACSLTLPSHFFLPSRSVQFFTVLLPEFHTHSIIHQLLLLQRTCVFKGWFMCPAGGPAHAVIPSS